MKQTEWKRQTIAYILERERRAYLDSLYLFVKKFWPIVEPEHVFKSNWHIRELCGLLQQFSSDESARILINVAPGTMKSLLISVFYPAWLWAKDPSVRVLTASYSAHLTIRDNLRMRRIISSSDYQQYFHLKIVDDENQKTRYATEQGGWRVATSVGGMGTGEHPDLIVIDDPTTAEQARSDTERSAANDWFDQTISPRGIVRNVKVIVIMQRLHEKDLTGHLLDKGGWDHICWPMRFDASSPDKRDKRKTDGELFWPSVFPEEKVRQLETDLGPQDTAGQLQQRPVPKGGFLFQRPWFRIQDASPAKARRVRGWDTAGTEGAGDYTVGAKIAEADGMFYIEDVQRGQWSPAGVDSVMLSTTQSDGKACAQREEREGGASGKAVIAARAKMLVGFDYSQISVSGDKMTRSKPLRAQCEAGNVVLIKGEWNNAYLDELCFFPVGKYDDQVDASSAAFNSLVDEKPKLTSVVWGRRKAS